MHSLRIRAGTTKFFQLTELYLDCRDGYKVEAAPDDVLRNLFSNIEHRLQFVTGLYRGDYLIIAHRVSDGRIQKSTINGANLDAIRGII